MRTTKTTLHGRMIRTVAQVKVMDSFVLVEDYSLESVKQAFLAFYTPNNRVLIESTMVVVENDDFIYISSQIGSEIATIRVENITEDGIHYDVNKRKQLLYPCVGDVINQLKGLPETARFMCCGDDLMYLHVSTNGAIAAIDTEDLDDCYD